MRWVDDQVLAVLNAVLPPIHPEDRPSDPPASRVMDGLVTADNETKIVTYPMPYCVYFSNVGLDLPEQMRLTARRIRRDVFVSIMYVGVDRNQAKWAGERIRDQLSGRRLTDPQGGRTRRIKNEASQRVRRDDDMIRPDGGPVFYGVDEYDLGVTLSHFPALVEA